MRFEKACGGGADMWLRMQAAHDLAKVRQSQQKITVRRLGGRIDVSYLRPALVEGDRRSRADRVSAQVFAALMK